MEREFPPAQMGTPTQDVVDTRWVSTWKEVEERKTEKARLVAEGRRDPEFRDGDGDNAGLVNRRPSHSQLVSLGALGTRNIWSLDIKNAVIQADGFDREVYERAPCE